MTIYIFYIYIFYISPLSLLFLCVPPVLGIALRLGDVPVVPGGRVLVGWHAACKRELTVRTVHQDGETRRDGPPDLFRRE